MHNWIAASVSPTTRRHRRSSEFLSESGISRKKSIDATTLTYFRQQHGYYRKESLDAALVYKLLGPSANRPSMQLAVPSQAPISKSYDDVSLCGAAGICHRTIGLNVPSAVARSRSHNDIPERRFVMSPTRSPSPRHRPSSRRRSRARSTLVPPGAGLDLCRSRSDTSFSRRSSVMSKLSVSLNCLRSSPSSSPDNGSEPSRAGSRDSLFRACRQNAVESQNNVSSLPLPSPEKSKAKTLLLKWLTGVRAARKKKKKKK